MVKIPLRSISLVAALLAFPACGGDGGGNESVDAGSADTYTIGGSVSGLVGDLTLQNNGGDELSLSQNGVFVFATALADGASYEVRVSDQPATQRCSVSDGSGTVAGADVTTVEVACEDKPPVERISVSSTGAQGSNPNNEGSQQPAISGDGRFIAFASYFNGLVEGEDNIHSDVFVHDRNTGETTLVSVATDGTPGNSTSLDPSISDDGRYVAFQSLSTNFIEGDTNNRRDVFLHDRQTGTTTCLSTSPGGEIGDATSIEPEVSGDGKFVVFTSTSSNLIAGDTNDSSHVFLYEIATGTTTLVSHGPGGVFSNRIAQEPTINEDGRYVAYMSDATNVVAGDNNGIYDVYLYDRMSDTTSIVSVDSQGVQGNGQSDSPSLSDDGQTITFLSYATNLAPGETNFESKVYVHFFTSGETRRVSVTLGGDPVAGNVDAPISISGNGRYVAYYSWASDVVAGDTNDEGDIFVHDLDTGTTRRASLSISGAEADDYSYDPDLTDDGGEVAFASGATNLVEGDTNGLDDIFVANTQ
jgi:Tol biopolymer transport system component